MSVRPIGHAGRLSSALLDRPSRSGVASDPLPLPGTMDECRQSIASMEAILAKAGSGTLHRVLQNATSRGKLCRNCGSPPGDEPGVPVAP